MSNATNITVLLSISSRRINASIEELTPKSILLCYKNESSNKQRTWYQLCKHIYDNDDHVTEEKLFMYIFYHSMRKVKKVHYFSKANEDIFSTSEYDKVMEEIASEESNNNLMIPNKSYANEYKYYNLIG